LLAIALIIIDFSFASMSTKILLSKAFFADSKAKFISSSNASSILPTIF
jgi:hypothetical protein